ncbi:MAG: response regulator [Bdellovibrionota bacterium]
MKIIVVDSDPSFSSVFARRCSQGGVECVVFAQVEAALQAIKQDPAAIDIVLISRELVEGGEAGLELARTIRKDAHTSDVPYIILSALWQKVDFARHQKTESGANAYFNKKTPLEELVSVIEAVTGQKLAQTKPAATVMTESKVVQAAGTKSTASFSASNVTLHQADELLNIKEELPGDLDLEMPANVFDDEEESTPGDIVESAPAAPVSELSGIDIPVAEVKLEGTGLRVSFADADKPLEKAKGQQSNPSIKLSLEEQKPVPLAPLQNDSVIAEVGAAGVSEEEAAKDLPYLFAGQSLHQGNQQIPLVNNFEGTRGQLLQQFNSAEQSDGADALKKYVSMREQDIAVLTAQLSYAKEELAKSEETIKRLNLQNEDLAHQFADLKRKHSQQQEELRHAGKSREGDLEQLRFEVKTKIDRIKFLEEKLTDSAEQYEKLKERVRLDIRKIRVREKELESKLEILKKDSETLISARENKILELKRKIDLLEFNYDTLQDKLEIEKQNMRAGQDKLERIAKVLRLALGIIETDAEQSSAEKPPQLDKDTNAA